MSHAVDISPSEVPAWRFRSIGRFLYTQNPFYLLSCFLIIYGLQVATVSQGDLVSRSLLLAGGIGCYTLLMAMTSIGVIRLGKVWEDGRSILLVVVVSLVALSTALDELCLTDPSTAMTLAIGGLFGGVLTTEVVLRSCRIAFPFWYRASYYAMLLVFFASPVLLGRAVAERHDRLANAGSVIFSCGIAVAMLLLIPAIRRGRSSVRHNGTPWRWPLYPLSAFVVLLVLAGIRSHAIWLSFGFFGESFGFEPFLLLPMLFAMLVLAVESDVHRRTPVWSIGTLYVAPAMLLCGLGARGMTRLPIADDLQLVAGSATTITMLSLTAFYAYAALRGVRHSEHALAGALIGTGLFAEISRPLQAAGIQSWVFVLLAALVYLLLAIRDWQSDLRWFAFAVLFSGALALAGPSLGRPNVGYACSAVFLSGAMLAIGWLFDTAFARGLRRMAAGCLTLGAGVLVAWHLDRASDNRAVIGLLAASAVTLGYWWLTRRFAWIYVFTVQATCLAVVVGQAWIEGGGIASVNVPLHSGMLCFAIGVMITAIKSGLGERLWPAVESSGRMGRFQMGL
ncbi:DUF2339 domain-containing protein [Neorhodopirellula pilleata]|uniref:Uncharacterized protein n=1 Tax=Neorhodopirellula pilleata TaxID=2714738 RepID=A0A5C6ASS5_9BACT|nr:hypothetical protein [Neorhodopirellula pilleata]TWU03093.1 hypothetical protein Pla100_00110 [Neorhodopirellula pilleata]